MHNSTIFNTVNSICKNRIKQKSRDRQRHSTQYLLGVKQNVRLSLYNLIILRHIAQHHGDKRSVNVGNYSSSQRGHSVICHKLNSHFSHFLRSIKTDIQTCLPRHGVVERFCTTIPAAQTGLPCHSVV
ncbi:hypothetical protein FR483_n607R [Paramecium bursaria Chlorella virus FR483]|uniref:Uncharacterized protein n607R n=1 Tax=Paramecium bursaria Chlorella virus FR483 TaxID=399781 RepID=A7J7W1_PBCVF|nr:hypothetical protein FR483_n607R [Paramecium bursaria Chlorella virus FR483]ABT15892.1 hypothetical protein FR483_n607R [Paramecium bursaria Chlorella virus FR483]